MLSKDAGTLYAAHLNQKIQNTPRLIYAEREDAFKVNPKKYEKSDGCHWEQAQFRRTICANFHELPLPENYP
jgi:hypothetical protein